MRVAVPKEIVAGERRVALVPQTAAQLVTSGLEVWIQSGAGEGAQFPDRAYADAGAGLEPDVAVLLGRAEVVLKVHRPAPNTALGRHEVEMMAERALFISLFQPHADPDLVRRLAERRITSLSLDLLPRISRAQPMDALSSMSTVAGYRAVLLAAHSLGKFFPMLTTAAGTLRPAKVLVLGAGVAGLQAIATARRLGAVVRAFDVRPAVKEQVESLGATFVEGALGKEAEGEGGYVGELSEEARMREKEILRRHVAESDVVITTALVPGKPAPLLITAEMVEGMPPGSVIVDLAADQGGNCEVTVPGKDVTHRGVMILGPLNVASSMPVHASQMYSRNISRLLLHLVRDGRLHLDFEDPITRECCVTHEGRILRGPGGPPGLVGGPSPMGGGDR